MKRTIELELYEQHEKVNFYTFRYVDADVGNSEFDIFFDSYNIEEFTDDIDIILYWIDKIGKDGAHDRNFRPEIGSLMALPMETSKLRLYTFKVDDGTVILGNGGHKTTAAFNDDPNLNAHAKNLLSIGSILMSQIKKGKVSKYKNTLFELRQISFEAI